MRSDHMTEERLSPQAAAAFHQRPERTTTDSRAQRLTKRAGGGHGGEGKPDAVAGETG